MILPPMTFSIFILLAASSGCNLAVWTYEPCLSVDRIWRHHLANTSGCSAWFLSDEWWWVAGRESSIGKLVENRRVYASSMWVRSQNFFGDLPLHNIFPCDIINLQYHLLSGTRWHGLRDSPRLVNHNQPLNIARCLARNGTLSHHTNYFA